MLPSQIVMDEMFDLDLALTMPDDDSTVQAEDRSGARHLLDEMPAVAMAEGGECAVCVEGGIAAKRIPCGHVFHENCISRWLSVNNSCPLCRQKFPPPPGKFSNS